MDEETKKRLRRERRGAKSAVTRKANEIYPIIEFDATREALPNLEKKLSELEEAFQRFVKKSDEYLQGLADDSEGDVEEAEDYHSEVEGNYRRCQSSATKTIRHIKEQTAPKMSMSAADVKTSTLATTSVNAGTASLPTDTSSSQTSGPAAMTTPNSEPKAGNMYHHSIANVQLSHSYSYAQSGMSMQSMYNSMPIAFPNVTCGTQSIPIMSSNIMSPYVKAPLPPPHISTISSPSKLNPLQPPFFPASPSVPPSPSPSSVPDLQRDLITALTLPKPDLTHFSGDVMTFKPFISAFDFRIGNQSIPDSDKLHYLHQYLAGEPRDLISGCFYMHVNGYQEARRLLDDAYGNTYKLTTAYIDQLSAWQPIRNDDSDGLHKLSCFLTRCLTATATVGYGNTFNHPETLRMIVTKLPPYLRNKWADKAHDLITAKGGVALNDLEQFVSKAARVANNPTFGRAALSSAVTQLSGPSHSANTRSKNVQPSEAIKGPKGVKCMQADSSEIKERKNPSACSMCNEQGHAVQNCRLFIAMPLDQRRNVVKEKGLCFACLGHGHISRNCRRRMTCDTCNKSHPTLLHSDKKPDSKRDHNQTKLKEPNNDAASCNTCSTGSTHNAPTTTAKTTVFQPVLPVLISHKESAHKISTYALLDSGSNACFLTQDLYEQLQLADREATVLHLNTMHGTTTDDCNLVTDLVVSDANDCNPIELKKVYSRPTIPVDDESIARAEKSEAKEFAHLLPPSPSNTMQVGLLIGTNSKLLEPLEVKSSKTGQSPFAVRYLHGWTVQGTTNNDSSVLTCNSTIAKELPLPKDVLQTLETDFQDIAPSHPDEKGLSDNDRRFLDIIDNGIKYEDGHYIAPLPLKNKSFANSGNRGQAASRLLWQSKKMKCDEKYRIDYVTFMQTLFEKGYCEVANDFDGNAWYLPHHGVYHPQKGKIRVVFDASAKFNGSSLNDYLYHGPDLTNNLIGVLTRFRLDGIGFTADLEAMFYQVRVPKEERRFLKFLWWRDNIIGGDMIECQMTVHIFGATSSPSVANYALRTIAFSTDDPDVRRTITDNFYVDDCLCSVHDIDKCRLLISNLCCVCRDGGFHLTKFMSNNRAVLTGILPSERAKEIKTLNLDFEDLPTTRALGISWDVESDHFSFNVQVKDYADTRRGVLSSVCSLYDPLGFAAPIVLKAKRLLQSLCNASWDQPLPEEKKTEWKKWLQDLPCLANIKISRCFAHLGIASKVYMQSAELHVFCDASTSGYGAVAYLRIEHEKGTVVVSFVAGKARVAPIKLQSKTVPKLELTAATVAVRMGCTIRRELRLEHIKTTFHTDSRIVLDSFKNEEKRFPVFVANRIQLIKEFSSVDQWRHVPTDHNPADHASRGMKVSEITTSTWLTGPAFLLEPEAKWPRLKEVTTCVTDSYDHLSTDDQDMTRTDLRPNDSNDSITDNPTNRLISYFSSWLKLRRAVAIFRRLPQLIAARKNDQSGVERPKQRPLSAAELNSAEVAILRWVQRSAFTKEIDLVLNAKGSKRILRKSSLYRLCPVIDSDGLLRLGGRLTKMHANKDIAVSPIILPRNHSVSCLIIAHTHIAIGHAGRNFVLSQLRAKYWVINGNSVVRHVISKCVPCRRGRGKVCEQQMAPLPTCRLDDSAPPFTYVGIDYFGPFAVRIGRRTEKRYGVLFTCMVSRAIHLELANSMDTSSFINVMRRFMSRRGPAQHFYSDNGTNIVGAKNELKKALDEIDMDPVQRWSVAHNAEWHFNPPEASHMGGAWERCIRSVRSVLFGLMEEQTFVPDDDTLTTLFCECENIVNSRPLATMTADPTDDEPLSPNHLLTLKSRPLLPPPGCFQSADVYLRKRWRRTQYLINVFWSRWRKEYLALLQPRSKWQRPRPNLQLNDIVLIKDDTPRNQWPMARVVSVYTDDHGDVRSVDLKTQTSRTLKRPIHKLVFLCSSLK